MSMSDRFLLEISIDMQDIIDNPGGCKDHVEQASRDHEIDHGVELVQVSEYTSAFEDKKLYRLKYKEKGPMPDNNDIIIKTGASSRPFRSYTDCVKFESTTDAQNVIDHLSDVIRALGRATLTDFYMACGLPFEVWPQNSKGEWDAGDVARAKVVHTGIDENLWIISIVPPKELAARTPASSRISYAPSFYSKDELREMRSTMRKAARPYPPKFARFSDSGLAIVLLEGLRVILSSRGVVTYADFYRLYMGEARPSDEERGWLDLKDASVMPAGGSEWEITLPEAVYMPLQNKNNDEE